MSSSLRRGNDSCSRFTSTYLRLCIASVIAIISSIFAINIATSVHQEPALSSQYIHEGTSVQSRCRDSIAGKLKERKRERKKKRKKENGQRDVPKPYRSSLFGFNKKNDCCLRQ